jgi:hypothetical protein
MSLPQPAMDSEFHDKEERNRAEKHLIIIIFMNFMAQLRSPWRLAARLWMAWRSTRAAACLPSR